MRTTPLDALHAYYADSLRKINMSKNPLDVDDTITMNGGLCEMMLGQGISYIRRKKLIVCKQFMKQQPCSRAFR